MNSYVSSSLSNQRKQTQSKTSDFQSQRIFELSSYKKLCEELIKKILPNQNLPITKKDIDNLETDKIDINNTAAFTEKIDNYAGCGQVRINGQIWSARGAFENDVFEEGETLRIIAIEGVKLVCKKS